MSSVKWVQSAVISVSLLLGACNSGGDGVEGRGFDGDGTPNSAPTAAITSPADGSVYPEGSNIVFTGTGSDSGDGVLSGAGLEWSSSTDGPMGSGITVFATLSAGTHTLSLNVTDSDGEIDTDTITLTVNAAPVVDNIGVNPASVDIGVSTTVSWLISDRDGDTLTCSLDADGNGTDDYTINDCANSTSQVHTYTQIGSYQVRLTVSDGVNAPVQQSVNVAVTAPGTSNASPQIANFDAIPDAPKTGNFVTFSWNVSDTDGDRLSCRLDIDANGTDDYIIDNCANNTSQVHTYTAAGDYQARLIVADGVNTPVQQSVSVTVTDADTGNAPPQVVSFGATPNIPKAGDVVTFSWNVSDADGDTLSCKLDVDADGADDYTIDDCANNTSRAHTYAQAGDHQVRLTVADGINSPVQEFVALSLLSCSNPMDSCNCAAPDTTGWPVSRVPLAWPFASDSFWNTPIGCEAEYTPAGFGPLGIWDTDEDLLFITQASDPLVQLIRDGEPSYGSDSVRCDGTLALSSMRVNFPTNVVYPSTGHNYATAILFPDGETFLQLNAFARCNAGGQVFGRSGSDPSTLLESIYGEGRYGGHGGSGLSSIGGTLRSGEATGDVPIRHALKINLRPQQMYFDRGTVEPTVAACRADLTSGERRNNGARWPAFNNDSSACWNYLSNNPELRMGALLAIPPEHTVSSLGIVSEPGRIFFHALQDYGLYVVDGSGIQPASHDHIRNSISAHGVVLDEFEARWGFPLKFAWFESADDRTAAQIVYINDIQRIIQALHVVSNNGPTSIGGGGTHGRRPPAPALIRP